MKVKIILTVIIIISVISVAFLVRGLTGFKTFDERRALKEGYRQGQIDCQRGKIKYKVVGDTVWILESQTK